LFKKTLIYWLTSFTFASGGFYILSFFMPKSFVFGAFYRMILYHWENPMSYISLPCFFFGIIAPYLTKGFLTKTFFKQLLTLFIIITLTIILSSPLGGMLWHYHDMKAGYFPNNWFVKIVSQGSLEGLQLGWLIILLSFPYNILGSIISFYLIKKVETLIN